MCMQVCVCEVMNAEVTNPVKQTFTTNLEILTISPNFL